MRNVNFTTAKRKLYEANSKSDSIKALSPTYCALKVSLQEMRGFKAGLFSLGYVFAEIIATFL